MASTATAEAGPSGSAPGSNSGKKTAAASKKKDKAVYQFKVTLKSSKPPIWRRIQVPGYYNFAQLHKVIILAMGWRGHHLHIFEMGDTKIGKLQEDPDDMDGDWLDEEDRLLDEKHEIIEDHFNMSQGHKRATYTYDFGDSWDHSVLLEKICPAEEGKKYPICITGKRACPPDDVGGLEGYDEFLKALANPRDSEHKEQMEWALHMGFKIGKEADFDPSDVNFAQLEADD